MEDHANDGSQSNGMCMLFIDIGGNGLEELSLVGVDACDGRRPGARVSIVLERITCGPCAGWWSSWTLLSSH